ncbi:MAG TPA: 6-phosphofructokinase [Pirellulales bacterium]|nr:6-phosphofructokinase [Pirellulales bacterium]
MSSPLSPPPHAQTPIHKVAIVFAGGPAPAANAVISAAADSFMRNGVQVVGIMNGYSNLMQFGPDRPLTEGKDYIMITPRLMRRVRSAQGIVIGTARANPGKSVSHPNHLDDPEKVQPLRTVYEALCSIGVDALISIGGDDTLKTANKLKLFQDRLPAEARHIPVVHLPKTIDNDYTGIDFTFGYFTAVDALAGELRNLLYDAEATRVYYLAETMGRSAGWLAYGAAIAGEASLVISVEDIHGDYLAMEESKDEETGQSVTREIMNVDEVVKRIVKTMRVREEKEGKQYGVIVVAEGLAEFLPASYLKDIPRDEHKHISVAQVNLNRRLARYVADEYKKQTGKERRVIGLQLGYEARCSKPHAFDVMLGSQLGVGAYRALIEKRLNGVMVSVHGQLELQYVPFEELVDPHTLVTMVRYIDLDSDFHKLARFLETDVSE